MKRVSYKPILERFNIPRPTLIEWQKCSNSGDNKNWRTKHIEYLREQIDAEEETKKELQEKAILVEELFLICVYLFLTCTRKIPKKQDFKQGIKEFLLYPKKSIELQHEFAKRIWKEEEDTNNSYLKNLLLMDSLSTFQYHVLIRSALDFNLRLFNNENLACYEGLKGKTWQELYMYNKEFSLKNIADYFKKIGILV
ncbi:MAG: hypothetical protein LBS26_01790 [Campylobacteraceae bacterium]|jgi:hypothetical protein|nr:hypothetical protein [Campylobacteraceae bacterium]